MISKEREKELEELISKLEDSNKTILEYISKEYQFACKLFYRIKSKNIIIMEIRFQLFVDYRKYAVPEYSEKIKTKCLEIINQLGHLKDKYVFIDVMFACFSEEASCLQNWFEKKAMYILEEDLKKFGVNIYKTMCFPHFGMGMEVIIFFYKDSELIKNKENGMLNYIREKFISILNEIGYMEKFTDEVKIEFDTDENVKRNYDGNYYFRSLG